MRRIVIDIEPNKLYLHVIDEEGNTVDTLEADGVTAGTTEQAVIAVVQDTIRTAME